MSVITVQLGQCGNQLGTELFSTIAGELNSAPEQMQQDTVDRFFRPPPKWKEDSVPMARAILIDMEPKVITKCSTVASTTGQWGYDPRRLLCGQSGSGNNWAYGYNVHGEAIQEEISELIRQEAELCDHVGGVHILQSAAGGTGSGLGCRVSEIVADEVSSADILSSVVWPASSGEVIVQNYNAVLTASRLSESSSGVLVLRNDDAAAVCRHRLRLERPSFHHLNSVLARTIATALLPASMLPPPLPSSPGGGFTAGAGSRGAVPMFSRRQQRPFHPLQDGLLHLCAHPAYKMLSASLVPQMADECRDFSTHRWPSLLRLAAQMHACDVAVEEDVQRLCRSGAPPSKFSRSVANVLILRGEGATGVGEGLVGDSVGAGTEAGAGADYGQDRPWIDRVLLGKQGGSYPSWARRSGAMGGGPLAVAVNEHGFNAIDKTALLLSNSQNAVVPLETAVSRAHRMFHSRAFLHRFSAAGVEDDTFLEAFERCEQILVSYNQL